MKKNVWIFLSISLCVSTGLFPNKIKDWEDAVLYYESSIHNLPLQEIIKKIPKKFEPALIRNSSLTQQAIDAARAFTPPASPSSSASSSRGTSPVPTKKPTPKKLPKPVNPKIYTDWMQDFEVAEDIAKEAAQNKAYIDWLEGFNIVEKSTDDNRFELNPDFYGHGKTAHKDNVGNTMDGIILLKDAVALIDENGSHNATNPNHWAHKDNENLVTITHGSHIGELALDTDVAHFKDEDMYIPLAEAQDLENRGLISLEENEDFGPWKASMLSSDRCEPGEAPNPLVFKGSLRDIPVPKPLVQKASTSASSSSDIDKTDLHNSIKRHLGVKGLKPVDPTKIKRPQNNNRKEILERKMLKRRSAIDGSDDDSDDENWDD